MTYRSHASIGRVQLQQCHDIGAALHGEGYRCACSLWLVGTGPT